MYDSIWNDRIYEIFISRVYEDFIRKYSGCRSYDNLSWNLYCGLQDRQKDYFDRGVGKEQIIIREKSEDRKKKTYKKIIILLSGFLILASAAGVMNSTREVEKGENGQSILKRKSYGEGSRQIELEAKIGEEKEKIQIELGERQYKEEDVMKELKKAASKLETLILGKNKSIDEVRTNLNLIEAVPKTGIKVSWDVEDYEVIGLSGQIMTKEIPEEGKPVRLRAVLMAGDKELEHIFYVRVLPPEYSKTEKQKIRLEQAVKEEEEKSREDSQLCLPKVIAGEPVSWYYPGESQTAGILLAGVALACGIFISEKKKEESAAKKRVRQLMVDYPQIISQLALFLKAGIPIRTCWFRIAADYEKNQREKEVRYAYEEMVYTMHEIEQGVTESECYERFGNRCGLVCYRRFGTLLSQNLRKGTKGLTDLLKREAEDAFEQRKILAGKLGEEAGTKLLGPMFMLLVMVIMIIIVPAFLSIQI